MNHIFDYVLLLGFCLVLISGSKDNPSLSAFHFLTISFILIWVAARLGLQNINSLTLRFTFLLIILYSIANLNYMKLKFIFMNLISLTLYKLVIFKNIDLSFRFHSNSDPYGYANASAYLKNNLSFNSLINEYLKVTGFDSFVWQSPTPLLTSPFAIPDQQMRYSAEVILAAGRSGFPLLFSQVLQLFSDPIIFFKIFLILGIIISVMLFFLTLNLINSVIKINYSKTKISNLIIFLGLYISQGWLILMVLEGQTPQIWTLCASIVFSTYIIRLFFNRLEPTSMLWFPIFITLTSITIVYPQSLINVLIIITLLLVHEVILFLFQKRRLTIKFIFTYLALIFFTLFLIHASKIMNDVVLSGISSNWGGGAIHIGFNNFFELFLPGPNNSLNITEPNFSPILNNNLFVNLSLFIAILFQIIIFILSYKPNPANFFINIISVSNGIVCLLYLYSSTFNKSIILNDYVYFRFQIQFIIFWIPAVFLNLYLIKTKYNLFSLKNIYLYILAVAITIASFTSISSSYERYTSLGHPVECPNSTMKQSIYYFSNNYFVNTMSFGICGEFNNLSDGNVPIFRIIKSGSEFRYIDPNTLKIGKTYILKQDLKNVSAPCFTECVMNLLKVQES